jgi:hypothetical protein
VDQGASYHEPLLLASGKLVDLCPSAVANSELFEKVLCACGCDAAPNTKVGGVEYQILEHAQTAVRIWALRDDSDALAHDHRVLDHIGAGYRSSPARRLHASGQYPDRCCFPRAIWTEQTEELSLRDLQVETDQRDDSVRVGTTSVGRCPAGRRWHTPCAAAKRVRGARRYLINLAQSGSLDGQ